MTGVPLIITFVLAIIVMIVAISKFKVHPFLSIMSVSLILALLAGIPLGDIANVIGAASPEPSAPSASSLSWAL